MVTVMALGGFTVPVIVMDSPRAMTVFVSEMETEEVGLGGGGGGAAACRVMSTLTLPSPEPLPLPDRLPNDAETLTLCDPGGTESVIWYLPSEPAVACPEVPAADAVTDAPEAALPSGLWM